MRHPIDIQFAETAEEQEACFEVLMLLRPQYSKDEMRAAVREMADAYGFRLVYVIDGDVKCVAGVRLGQWLHRGKFLEIDDLVTRDADRSAGYGGAILDWLMAYAKAEGCQQVRLVSGVSRERAHAFYERKGMMFEAKYFSIDVA